MNKQEVIEKINNITAREAFMSEFIWVKRDEVIDIVKQIDEPKKAVVPQYIDTWIQGAEYNGFDLYEAMTDEATTDDEIPDKVATWIESHSEEFAKAWLYGYEVEKEKLYTVEIPNPHGLGHTVLVKDMYGNTFITYTTDSNWREGKVNHLTESEIKKDFPWAWQFAEEVKE